MRGILLAGGTGSRLGPLTKTINKHLLPVGALPMIFYPLDVLVQNDCEDITIVSTARGVGQIAELLSGDARINASLTYRVQDQPGGIAQALALGADGTAETLMVILGDNVFLPAPVLLPGQEVEMMARCFLYLVRDNFKLRAFGVPRFDGRGKLVEVIEKPSSPPSSYAVTGLYVFGSNIATALKNLPPGKRGEMEIADLLDMYAQAGGLKSTIVDGFWGDAGTVDGLRECAEATRLQG